MALTLLKNKSMEHHKNPSGVNNKANWLVVHSKRNVNEVHNLVKSKIIMCGYEMYKSWIHAEELAIAIINLDAKKRNV